MIIRMALIALALASPAAAQTVEQRAALLAEHNAERATLGQKPLVWDDALAARAAIWAEHMAQTGVFEHDKQKTDGENLWMGTKGAYVAKQMVGSWIVEKAFYRNGKFPNVSTTPKWEDVGHYTQLIWHSTKRIGCAIRSDKAWDYLVCRYDPPGNWMGEQAIPPGPIGRFAAKRKPVR